MTNRFTPISYDKFGNVNELKVEYFNNNTEFFTKLVVDILLKRASYLINKPLVASYKCP